MKRALCVVLAVVISGCGGSVVLGDTATGGGTGIGGGTGSGGGSAAVSVDGGTFVGLPCDVATVLANNCASCHGPVVAGAAPWPLVTRDELLQVDPGFSPQTKAQRSLIRMQAATMPPFPATAVSAADVAIFQAWVTGGTPTGTCGTAISTPDAGPAPTTCASGSYWTGGNRESNNMNPGMACQACHLQQEPAKAYFFMGTVFPAAHEKDLCNSPPPSGTRVEIIDANGATVLTLSVNSPSGNFFNTSRSAYDSNGRNIAMPYRARVVAADGGVSTMTTPQTSGDCNSCHTEQGLNGAPGRIVHP